jgi:filamentous hemagglutinin
LPAILGAGALSAVARTAMLREAIPAAQKGRITMAVGLAKDANGKRQLLISTSERYFRGSVKRRPGEIRLQGTGHAETDILNFARQNDLKLLEIGATRPICPSCAARIKRVGAKIVTPLKIRTRP